MQTITFLIKKGHRLAVLRPKDPALALRLTEEFKATGGSKKEFDRILKAQSYTFVGFAGQKGVLLNEKGAALGRLEQGDSLILAKDVQKCLKTRKSFWAWLFGRTRPAEDVELVLPAE